MNKRKIMIRFAATKKFDEADYYLKTVIRRAVSAALEYERFPYDAEVSVTLCDNEYIRKRSDFNCSSFHMPLIVFRSKHFKKSVVERAKIGIDLALQITR